MNLRLLKALPRENVEPLHTDKEEVNPEVSLPRDQLEKGKVSQFSPNDSGYKIWPCKTIRRCLL